MKFKSDTDRWVTAEQGGGLNGDPARGLVGPPPLVADRTDADLARDGDGWQQFTVIEHEEGTFSLRCPSGHYVTAEYGGGGPVSTDREVDGPWQRFSRDGDLVLCSDHVHYLKVRTDLARPVVDATGSLRGLRFHRPSVGVDPSTFSLEQLARIRGAMWTVPGPWAYGPRPGRPDNITALEFLGSYPADVQAQMLAHYRSFGYTHGCIGPINAQSYHGQYPDRDFTGAHFSAFLDLLQTWWDAGIAPIVFLHPDNATLEETQALYEPLIRGNARAQRLIRIIVPAGWEPTRYGWSAATWAAFLQWGHDLLPHALVLLHTVMDVDAPVGTDDRGDDNGKPNAEGWHRVAPHLHGWLVQSSAFEAPDAHGDPNHPDRTNFQNWVDLFDPFVRGSYPDRFRAGYAGWPTGSLWGRDTPIRIYAGEYCSYWVYWEGRSYAEGCAWGDAAIRAGADGYLDGGTVDVP